MKKIIMSILFLSIPIMASAYIYGDYQSVTLVVKAWEALEKGDSKAVWAYTSKCIELYEKQAKEMQAGLKDYAGKGLEVEASKPEIFKYWALNDIATAYFIQGEMFRYEGDYDKAIEAYQTVIDEYKYGQCWDPKGWFWKPAEGAAQRIEELSEAVIK